MTKDQGPGTRDLSSPPNIILINCDDLGYGDIGCYGSTVNKTPVLDRMADEGMRFTDFYMASSICSPSRGAMMTGSYPPRIGFANFDGQWVLFPGQGIGLNPDEITVASLLKEQGYATKLVGKWHCGDQPEFLPTRHGFDSYYGLPYSNDMGIQKGREDYPPLPLMQDDTVLQQQPDQASLTERYVEQSVRFMRENREGPFFLYLAHMYVHLPLYAPERFMEQSENGAYGAAVECVDWAAGMILSELKALGIDENTMVIFTSDNGSNASYGASNQPLRGTKGTTWEGGMRVPFIVRWPGAVPAGATCSEVTCSIDVLPTFTSMAGGTVPGDRVIDGRDISSLMLGQELAPRDSYFYYFKDELEAVRSGQWKLFVSRHNRKEKQAEPVCELYDLENDVAETDNVAAEHPDVVERLTAMTEACRADIGDAATGVTGANCRPIGRVDNPDTLTHYDESHPYIVAMYDMHHTHGE